jgi:hypothetical protein
MSKDELYKIFIKWYAQPEDRRDPKTIRDFAIHHELSPADIASFQERDNYYDDLYKEAQNWGKSKIPELLHLLYAEFKSSKKAETLRVYKELLKIDDDKRSGLTINILNPNDNAYRQIVQREARLLENGSIKPFDELLPDSQS